LPLTYEQEEKEALALFETTASKRWQATVHELRTGVLKLDQLCDAPVAEAEGRRGTSPKRQRAVQRLLTLYDVEVNRRRQAIRYARL
jgi:hypothetical protein